MIVLCKKCEIEFDKDPSQIRRTNNNNFCSRSCAASYNNVGIAHNPPVVRLCKLCADEYTCSKQHRSRTLCKDCWDKLETKTDYYKQLTLGHYHEIASVKYKHPSWINSHVRIFARSWNKLLTKLPCQVCGYVPHIELCHIKPISDFSVDDTLGSINSPDNILVLCRNHHWEFDNGYLNIKSIPSR